MQQMVELNDVRLQLSTDMANCLDSIRSHVIRIEDSRIINDMYEFPKILKSVALDY
jgi:hypothetical protein